MRQADRVLKAVYRERFVKLTQAELNNTTNQFSFNSKLFKEQIKIIYQSMYPENYTGDEIDAVFHSQCSEIKKVYQSTNTVYLIPLYANKLLYMRNGEVTVSYPNLLEWNGFQNKVDSNLFVAAYAATNNLRNSLESTNIVIKHDNDRLYKTLAKGICEGHMHLKGSGQTTELSWNNILKMPFLNFKRIEEFIAGENNFLHFKSFGYSEDDILLMVLKLKLVRILLNNLEPDDTVKEKLKLNQRVTDLLPLVTTESLKDFLQEAHCHQELLNKLVNESSYKITKLEKQKGCLPDRIFYYEQFHYLLNGYFDDNSDFLYYFNYYIWGASVLKFEFYQDNLGMGFQKFKYFENIKDELVEDNELIYRSVFQRYYEEGNVCKIEMRVAPKAHAAIKQTIAQLARINDEVYAQYAGKNNTLQKIDFALIIHYIKNDDLALHPDNIDYGRFHKYIEELKKNDKYVSEVLYREKQQMQSDCEYKSQIVAIDTANTEVATPPEIFGPYFRKHRESMDDVKELKFTYHVGEEFKTLESGLRYIDNAIDFLAYRRGDRLGHALALGLDVRKYYKRKRYRATTSLQDYIDNIAWLYDMYANDKEMNYRYMTALQSRFYTHIGTLIPEYMGANITIEDYAHSLFLRGDDREAYRSLQEVCESRLATPSSFAIHLPRYELYFNNAKVRELHHKYLYDSKLIENGLEPICYDVDDLWLEIVEDAQRLVTQKIISKGIIVEANPSSNRKISSVAHYTELPFLQMNSYKLEHTPGKQNVSITINTDDSAIFQTNLSNEYSLVACALERDGYDIENIYEYIDYLREASHTYLFF